MLGGVKDVPQNVEKTRVVANKIHKKTRSKPGRNAKEWKKSREYKEGKGLKNKGKTKRC